jgi:pimeloyl-ACP methyl ester carboxylesterase
VVERIASGDHAGGAEQFADRVALTQALPHAEVLTCPRAGHIPHVTCPDAYAEAIIAFVRKHSS